jgi:hypothetical protein
MMRHDGVLKAHLAQRHRLVRVRHLLQVVIPGDQGVDEPLRGARLQQMQDSLRILGIVLVPRVVHRITRASHRERGHLAYREARQS